MKTLLIIDGNSLVNRAFYGVPILTTKEGEYTNAVYGFFNILVRAIIDHKPDYIAVAFDHARKTFRNELYEEYKAGRKQMPDELRPQFPIIKDILSKANVKVIEQANIEADDIIGTLAKRFKEQTIILTGDRDALQLIDDSTNVWLTKKGISEVKMMDRQAVIDDFSITPEQVVDFKAIMGDKSDNIPGVKGIGEVGAVKLLTEFNTLENIYQNVENLPNGIKLKLIADKEIAFLSQKLATIKTDCDIDCKIEDCIYDFPFTASVYNAFKKYEFGNLLKRSELFCDQSTQKEVIECENVTIKTEEEFTTLFNKIKDVKKLAIYVKNDLHLAFDEHTEYTINFENDLFNLGLEPDSCLLKLKGILEDKSVLKCVFDYKELKKLLAKKRIELVNCFDCALAEYLLNASDKNFTISQLAISVGYEKNYALALFAGKEVLTKKLRDENLYKLYSDLEFPLCDVLYDMEKAGLRVDRKQLENASIKYNEELEELNKQIITCAGVDFNVNSPKQLSEVLFDKLKITCVNNKSRSTAIDILQMLEDTHEIIPLIIRYRKIQKLKATYIDAFMKLYDDGYIYTVFNQMVTATGRLSSKEPNMQNIPTRDEEGKHIKQIFISRFENGKIVSADYSQIELKLMAHFSNDDFMIATFNAGKDIHTATAAKIHGINESEVTKAQRREAKAVNFGMIYGQSAYGLASGVGISVKAAGHFMNTYFATYPKVKKYMEESIIRARENDNTALTLFGRKRKINELSSSNRNLRNFGERAAMNMPLQGSASDIIKLAMIEIHNEMKSRKMKSKLILQIHDELIIDAAPDEVDAVCEIFKQKMENVVKLSVKLNVELGIGDNMLEAK